MTTPAQSADIRRKRTILIWLASVAWLVLAFFAVTFTRVPIEKDLMARSEEALVAAGFDMALVSFDGRDATLTGSAVSDTAAESAEAVVLAVDGVRVVENLLTVEALGAEDSPPSETTPTTEALAVGATPPSFVMLVSDGTVALTGSVPDEDARDSLVAGAVEAFGLENVVSTFSVSEAVGSTEWLVGLPFLLAEMGDVTEFSLVIAGGTAELSGLAVSMEAHDSIENLVAASLPGLEVVNLLEIGSDERELVQGKLNALDLASISFEVGSTELAARSTAVLDGVAAILADHPDLSVEVGGHTDATGTEETNVELSQARAHAVVDYLVSKGIAEARLTAVGYGSSKSIADNLTPEGRALNRRIEIVVLP